MTARHSIGQLLPTGFLLLMLLGLTAGCGGNEGGSSQEETGSTTQEEEHIAGEFVGEVSDTFNNALVAILADPAEPGEPRRVRAYLSDGQTIFEWFMSSAEGNEISLTSDGGAQLEGSLTSDEATGTITLADSQRLVFAAPLATGFADLYEVNILSGGRFNKSSERGGRLEGRILEEANEDGLYPADTILTSPERETLELTLLFDSDFEFGESRWIVSADGQNIKAPNVQISAA